MEAKGGFREKPVALRVLVVEDEALVAQTLGRCFVQSGHVVRLALSALEALAVAAEGSFDCGVFDIQVGGEDGVDLAESLVSSGHVGAAVFYSGTVDERVRARASQVGPFVNKGESFDQLLNAVLARVRAP